MASNLVRFDEIRSKTASAITASYLPLGLYTSESTPSVFDHSMRLVHFINGTDGIVMFSFDGVTDNVILLAGSFALYDMTSNEDTNEEFRYQRNTQLYVKYLTAPSIPTDKVYVVTVYGKGE